MIMKTSFRTLLLGCCLMAVTPAFAQEIRGGADAGRVEGQVRKLELDASSAPEINVPEVRVEGAPQGADSMRFVLKDLTVEGVTAYNQAELEQIYAGDIGQTITLTRLYEIAGQITRKYRNDGYIITQTVVPTQTIDGGHARLLVVEGSLDQILVEGPLGPNSREQIQRIANHLHASQPLKSDDLERYLLLINDLPGVSARSVIGPSATQTGKADIRILLNERDDYDFFAGVDNYGSQYLGPWQLTGAVVVNDIFDMNDSFLFQEVASPMDDELYYTYAAYSMPLGSQGTKLVLDYAYSDTKPGYDLEIFDVEGFATTVGATLTHPFIRSRNENLTGRLRMEGKTSSTKSELGVSTDDDIRSVRLGARYELLSTFLGTSVNMVDMQVSKGLSILGASGSDDPDLSRAEGDPTYVKFEAEITRLQRIVQGFNVLVGVKGQISPDNLLSSEEIGFGGMGIGYGRGYDPSEIVGDDGVAAKVELQYNAHWFDEHIESLQLFTFFDVASVYNSDATTPDDEKNSIASTGVGFRTRLTDAINFDATAAFPMTEPVAANGDRDPRFLFSLTSSF